MKKFNLDKSITYKSRLLNTLVSEWTSGAKNCKNLDVILENCNFFVFNTVEYKRLQKWAQYEIKGAHEALLKIHYNYLEWVTWYDGVFMGLTKKYCYKSDFNPKLMSTGYVYKGTEILFNKIQN